MSSRSPEPEGGREGGVGIGGWNPFLLSGKVGRHGPIRMMGVMRRTRSGGREGGREGGRAAYLAFF